MNAIIQNTISQYVANFIENVSTKFNISTEELEEIWKQTQKEKLKIVKRRTNHGNKAPSAYINFCSHHRKVLKSEKPDLKFGEVAKALGALWKELGEEEKKKYSDPSYVGTTTTTTAAVPAPEEKKKRGRKHKE